MSLERYVREAASILAPAVKDAGDKASRDVFGTIALDSSGNPTVMLDGAEAYTPCTAMVGVHHGDRVMAHVVNHRLVVFANVTAPTTDDSTALVAIDRADLAAEAADEAAAAAASAQGSADAAARAAATADAKAVQAIADAATAAEAADAAGIAAASAQADATQAKADASTAKSAAQSASKHATAALDQLGIVQDVVGVLDWASKHGTFAKTTDTAIQDGKVYFTYDGTDYTPVVEPQASQLSNYYELSMTEAMNDFILAHLAVTARGLWVLPSGMGSASDAQYAPNYKVLLSNDGMYVYDGSGNLVSNFGENITFSSTHAQYIGNEDSYIIFTPEHTEDGKTVDASIIIGGNVIMGGSKTLSEWLADMQQAVDDSAEAVQTANDVPIVTLSSTRGTVFKRNVGVSTTIVATIYTPGGRIATAAELAARFGAGAYLEWGWRDVVTDAEHVLLVDDPRIGNGGFTLTVTPDDIDEQAVITCSLNY